MTDQADNLFNLSADKLELLDLLLADEGLADVPSTPAIVPRSETNDPLPLSFAQERLWFVETLTPGSSLFNTSLPLQLKGQLNEVALQQACQALAERHESLRTTFTAVSGLPQQIVHSVWPVLLDCVDLSGIPQEAIEGKLRTAVQQPFDLEKGPLFRTHLFRLGATEHILLLVFHHIVFDGWSAGIILKELVALYEALSQQRQPDLPARAVQYADYALWQREWLTGENLQSQLDYWLTQLGGELPLLQLPTDKARPKLTKHPGATQSVTLSAALTKQLRALCQQTGATSFMLLLAAFKVLLHRYTNQEDILVGTPIANRQQAELEEMVGFFVNTLVLRSQLNGQMPFRQLLAQVRTTATEAYDHQDVPFAKLVEVLQPERHLSHNPLFEVMFAYRDSDVVERPLPDLDITVLDLDNGMAQFDLTFSVDSSSEQFHCSLNYNEDLFLPETISRLLAYWQVLLAGLVADPDSPIGLLPLLTPDQIQQTTVAWNDTAVSLPAIPFFHEQVAEWAEQTPQAPALVYGQQTISYAALNARANQLAHALQARGIGPESKVGIFAERSPLIVEALLAVFKAGGAYVPLDPTYPPDRLSYMAEDAALALILTTENLLDQLPGKQVPTLCLDKEWNKEISQQPEDAPTNNLSLQNLAYIIYTSGSTGKPKGAMITHGGLTNYLHWAKQAYPVAAGGALVHSSIGFDLTITSLYLPLLVGQPVHLLPEGESTTLLSEALTEQGGWGLVKITPAHLLLLNQTIPVEKAAAATRSFVIGGEQLTAEQLAFWRQNAPNTRLFNEYGPTETVVGCAIYEVRPEDSFAGAVPIGCPIANTQLYVLNEWMQPVPIGGAGELYIGGFGVARGYLKRPSLTAEKFVPDPFSRVSGARLYRTGDLARLRPDGNLEFLGRVDHQVKIRGYRIELGEIEVVLGQHENVRETAVLVQEAAGGPRLVAYIVPEQDPGPSTAALRHFLAQTLPDYMVPALFVSLETMPLTVNGKVDRNALPEPDSAAAAEPDAFVAPQDGLESQLAQLWQDVLQLPTISVDANYFEIGGHSLQAVALFAAIEKRLKVRLPVSLLFEAPTIRQLAAAMRLRGDAPQQSALVPIQPLGHKTPLFCVHGGAGHVFHYRELAQLLGRERPFYGLQPRLDEATQEAFYHSVEEMAAYYIQEIKTVQPQGPYLLSGFCFGGIVVYEMAQQLLQAGEEVQLLAFIDPSTPQNKPGEDLLPIPEQIAERLARHQKNMRPLGDLARLGYILNSIRNRLVAYWYYIYRSWLRGWRKGRARLIQHYINWRHSVPSRFSDFYFMHVVSTKATQEYYPQQYPGEAILFCSTLENGGDDSLGWSDLPTDGLKIYTVASTHLGILKRPYIDQVAEKLSEHLESLA